MTRLLGAWLMLIAPAAMGSAEGLECPSEDLGFPPHRAVIPYAEASWVAFELEVPQGGARVGIAAYAHSTTGQSSVLAQWHEGIANGLRWNGILLWSSGKPPALHAQIGDPPVVLLHEGSETTGGDSELCMASQYPKIDGGSYRFVAMAHSQGGDLRGHVTLSADPGVVVNRTSQGTNVIFSQGSDSPGLANVGIRRGSVESRMLANAFIDWESSGRTYASWIRFAPGGEIGQHLLAYAVDGETSLCPSGCRLYAERAGRYRFKAPASLRASLDGGPGLILLGADVS